tara:strand:+ start:233 stop:400 length:168 start_codon:yes stop_codon:yes gene_type:complete
MDLEDQKKKIEQEITMLERQIAQIDETKGQMLTSLLKKKGQVELLDEMMKVPTEE